MVSQLEIGIGSCIMLHRNLNISKGLANESTGTIVSITGTIVSITWPALQDKQLEEGEIPKFIEVNFDDLPEKVKIYPITVEFGGNPGFGEIQRCM